jgi:hypothetical protein
MADRSEAKEYRAYKPQLEKKARRSQPQETGAGTDTTSSTAPPEGDTDEAPRREGGLSDSHTVRRPDGELPKAQPPFRKSGQRGRNPNPPREQRDVER